MSFLRNRLLTAFTGTIAISIALAGCSGGNSGNGGGSSPLPDERQNLTYVLNWGCSLLDPTVNFTNCSMQVISNVMQALVALDPKSHQPKPLLATSWTWTNPTTLELKLRDDVTFSDGAKFTSADVAASLDRYIATKSALGAQLEIVSSYAAVDPTTLVIKTKRPTGTLLGVLSVIFIGQAAHAAKDSYWAKPVGTGPFVIDNFVANDHISLSRNERYWGSKAKLKTLTFKQIDQINSRITALANGEAQVIAGVPNDQVPIIETFDDVTFTQIPSLTYNMMWFHNKRAPFTDARVRTAMWKALDLPTIVSSLLGDTATPMKSLCPEVAFGCLPSTNAPGYDVAGAKKLLAEAGYPNGFRTTIDFSTANVGNDQLISAMISYWKAIGVTVTPKADDQATFTVVNASPGGFDMIVNPNLNVTGDADFTLNRLYTCTANRLGFCNPQLDALLTKAQQEQDPAKRLPTYQQVSDIFAEQAPAIGLYQIKINVAASKQVRGLTLVPSENYDWSTVYLVE